MDKLQQGAFGPIYTQFKGKPKEAIKFLKEQKQGECIASLHRDDIGNIDIVWGEVTDSFSVYISAPAKTIPLARVGFL